MNTVPNMISTKDLDFIKDMLNWNHGASKKASHFLEEVEDEEVVNVAKEMANLHAEHFQFLLNILR